MVKAVSTLIPKSLAGTELFLDLAPSALAHVAARARVRHLAKSAMIFAQGQLADRCYALLAGRVRIVQADENGARFVVRFIGPGEMFGTMALFTDRHYPAEAVTVIDSVEISWTEGALVELIHDHPQIAINLVKIVGARLREAQERLRELATQRVEQRMAHVLLRLAERQAVAGGGSTTIDFPLTRQDLANMCGTTLYSASRILTAWGKAGFLETHRRRLTLLNLPELRRLAAQQSPHEPS